MRIWQVLSAVGIAWGLGFFAGTSRHQPCQLYVAGRIDSAYELPLMRAADIPVDYSVWIRSASTINFPPPYSITCTTSTATTGLMRWTQTEEQP